jgi:hypothetical protein
MDLFLHTKNISVGVYDGKNPETNAGFFLVRSPKADGDFDG